MDAARSDRMSQRVYDELRELARLRVRQGLAGRSLQATALVHEVWLKLSEAEGLGTDDSGRYYATAAQAMRWILVDRARRRRLARRSEDALPVEELGAVEGEELDVLQLDEALDRLERSHPRKAQIVMHRYFAGLSVEETARALELSTATVKREWCFARAWLRRELDRLDGGASAGPDSLNSAES